MHLEVFKCDLFVQPRLRPPIEAQSLQVLIDQLAGQAARVPHFGAREALRLRLLVVEAPETLDVLEDGVFRRLVSQIDSDGCVVSLGQESANQVHMWQERRHVYDTGSWMGGETLLLLRRALQVPLELHGLLLSLGLRPDREVDLLEELGDLQ